MDVFVQVGIFALGALGVAAAIFGVVQGVEWLLGKFGWSTRRLAGKGRVVRRGSLATFAPGDASRFVRDVEFVDGTVLGPSQRFRKTWEIQNVGSMIWEGRYLQRVGAAKALGLIRTPMQVPIPTTRPGEFVQLSVEMETPPTEGTTTARFKMTDRNGNLCFPDRYPEGIFVTVNVVEQGDQ